MLKGLKIIENDFSELLIPVSMKAAFFSLLNIAVLSYVTTLICHLQCQMVACVLFGREREQEIRKVGHTMAWAWISWQHFT